jgi:hypothetical protein
LAGDPDHIATTDLGLYTYVIHQKTAGVAVHVLSAHYPGMAMRCMSLLPSPRAAASLITDVTVYQGQALVTREVSVPAGEGSVELVVMPLPAQTADGMAYEVASALLVHEDTRGAVLSPPARSMVPCYRRRRRG